MKNHNLLIEALRACDQYLTGQRIGSSQKITCDKFELIIHDKIDDLGRLVHMKVWEALATAGDLTASVNYECHKKWDEEKRQKLSDEKS